MTYQNERIDEVAARLRERLPTLAEPSDILKAVELKALYAEIPSLPPEARAPFGQEVNSLRTELETLATQMLHGGEALPNIDVTAPFDVNVPPQKRPRLRAAEHGSRHPLMTERETVLDIFYRMGFTASESRELDDEFHMFTSLNFPEGHPARDDYDTFST
ncbi:MAG TPA: hypothetical protein VJP80_08535, partial [Candidatus Saccharimonadales bacterium]|nr:hypothetical protein [Candidatus Saccharimonadales bacterium]